MKRVMSLAATASIMLGGGIFAVVGGATSASAHGAASGGGLPTMKVALNGTSGVKVSGSTVSGAVKIVSTFKGKPAKGNQGGPSFGLLQLRPGVSFNQAFGAFQRSHGDLNAITPYATLLVDASAPGTVETLLTPGNYAAINTTGHGKPAVAPFTVSSSSSPATLPKASATESAIEFGFKGPKVLTDGTMVRARDKGYLVHMVVMGRVASKAAGRRVMAYQLAGKNAKASKLYTGTFVSLANPLSPGGMQQMVLHTKPGYYVEECFMNTQDGREHTQLGMQRLIKVVK